MPITPIRNFWSDILSSVLFHSIQPFIHQCPEKRLLFKFQDVSRPIQNRKRRPWVADLDG
jgi:hypothetical protein